MNKEGELRSAWEAALWCCGDLTSADKSPGMKKQGVSYAKLLDTEAPKDLIW